MALRQLVDAKLANYTSDPRTLSEDDARSLAQEFLQLSTRVSFLEALGGGAKTRSDELVEQRRRQLERVEDEQRKSELRVAENVQLLRGKIGALIAGLESDDRLAEKERYEAVLEQNKQVREKLERAVGQLPISASIGQFELACKQMKEQLADVEQRVQVGEQRDVQLKRLRARVATAKVISPSEQAESPPHITPAALELLGVSDVRVDDREFSFTFGSGGAPIAALVVHAQMSGKSVSRLKAVPVDGDNREWIVADARGASDLTDVLLLLSEAWLRYLPLVVEIGQLQQQCAARALHVAERSFSYAIDWVASERRLSLLLSLGVRVDLRVERHYPAVGAVSLVAVNGRPAASQMAPPPEDSVANLRDWLRYLSEHISNLNSTNDA